MNIVRTDDEVSRVMNWAEAGINTDSRYPDLSYEQGVFDALMWLYGSSDIAPDEDW